MSHQISLTPVAFTMVKFDAAELLAIAESAATGAGVPDAVEITIDVDEALPLPLIASAVAARDGKIDSWFSGGCFESPKYQAILEPDVSKTEFGAAFLRGRDRLDGGFEDAPPDGEISERQRAIWDVYTDGRLAQLGGFVMNEPRRRYTYRLRCGFNDVADAEYQKLWKTCALSWAELEEIEGRLAAADPRPAPKKSIRPVSLRQS